MRIDPNNPATWTPGYRKERARNSFHVRIGGVRKATRRCECTAPLFPLWLILDADGTLAHGLAPLVERTQA